ncbi:MAG: hypothetical protein RBT46_03795 [Weeksellaceae bacterium]|jgi:hypothetical protein|nr:hypothetical protein [Weeksellaceae bacterium]
MKKLVFSLLWLAGITLNAQNTQDLIIQDLNYLSAFSNDINAGSARYIGMGGSMGALGGDVSAGFQNPAGSAIAINSEVNTSLGFTSFRNTTKFGSSNKTSDNAFLLQNVGANFVFLNEGSSWNRFTIGIKYAQENLDNWIKTGRNNNITKTELSPIPEEYTTYTMAGYQDITEGYKNRTTLDFGASFKDQLFLGLGFNFHETRYNNYVFFDEDTQGTVYRYDLNGTPYSATANGFSLSAGLIGKANDYLRFGLAYHSPIWYSRIEENYYADLPIDTNFENYYYDYYYSEYDRSSNGRLVASAGLIVAKSLALNLDYTLHMNGSTKLKPSKYFYETNDFLNHNYKSNSEIRVGSEYRIDNFRLRAGYNFVQSPFKEISLNADPGSGNVASTKFSDIFQGNINRISFGAGYNFGGFYLDAAYQFQNQKYTYLFGNGEYVDYDAADNTVYYASLPLNANHNYASTIKNNKGLFVLTAGWQF